MLGLKIAASTRAIPGPIKKALHIIASQACDGVQLEARNELRPADLSDTGLRHLQKMLNDLNLRVGSIAFTTRRGLGSREQFEPRLEAALETMRMASKLGARIMVCQFGRISSEPDAAWRNGLIEALIYLARHGDRLGVQMAGQAHHESVQAAVELVEVLPDRAAALDLHPAQLLADGISPSEFTTTVGPNIAHVHAVDGVYDLDSGRSIEVELGRGTADFPQLLGLLEEHAYRGWLTIVPSGTVDPASEIGNGVKFLRSM